MDISEEQLAEEGKVHKRLFIRYHSYQDMCISVLVEFGENSF